METVMLCTEKQLGIKEKKMIRKTVRILGIAALCAGGIVFADKVKAQAETAYDYVVTEEGYEVDGTDKLSDWKGLQQILNQAVGATKEVTIYVPDGTYYIDKPLRIYSNTHLILSDNATIYRMDEMIDRGMIHNADQDGNMDVIGGYDMSENITMEGGIWDGGNVEKATQGSDIIRFDHAKNITVKNCIVKNTYDCHLIELVGIKNGTVSGCTLTGFRYKKGHEKDWTCAREAIQLETAWTNNEKDKSDISSLWAKGSVVDGTSCQNVTVIKNKVVDFPCGIGQHHYTASGKYRDKGIIITQNTITISAKWKYCKTAITCGGINDITISDNVVKGPYRFSVHVVEADDVSIKNNKLSGTSMNAIMVDSGSVTTIANNTISEIGKHGISVGGGKVTRIEKNTVKKVKIDGISVDDGTVKLISSNAFQNISKHGISITGGVIGSGKKQSLGILNNKISTCKANGITVSGKSKVSAIHGNKVTGVKNNGISVTDKARVYWITGNTIKNCAKHGIWNGSTVLQAKVSGNKGKIK